MKASLEYTVMQLRGSSILCTPVNILFDGKGLRKRCQWRLRRVGWETLP